MSYDKPVAQTSVKPLPQINEGNRPFWEALNRQEFRLQQCTDCAEVRYPIAPICPRCLSDQFEWKLISGRGTVFSFVVFHQVYHAAFKDDVPYNVLLVQLDEGPRMFSNMVGIPNDQIQVGSRVEVVYDKVTDAITIPRFRPVSE